MNNDAPLTPAPSGPAMPPAPPANFFLRKIFFNANEPRAGWRLLIFVVIMAALFSAVSVISRRLGRGRPIIQELVAFRLIIAEGVSFLLVLLASLAMSKFERRPVAIYGLPGRDAFRRHFWAGILWGFGSLTALLLVLRATGSFYFGQRILGHADMLRYGVLFATGFLMVGLFEEYFTRGYPLFTLTTGMGFWPSAILLSLVFGLFHTGNSGEDRVGIASAVLIALFFCFTLKRTGTLWFAVGYHASWDWGQSFFYGTADSGIMAAHHLRNSSISGPGWLSGGTVGPEGSVLVLPLIGLLFAGFHYAFKDGNATGKT